MIFHSRLLQRAALDRFAMELAGIRHRFAEQDRLSGVAPSRIDPPLPPVGGSGAEWEALLDAVACRLRRVADTSLAAPRPEGDAQDQARVLECVQALETLHDRLHGQGAMPPRPAP